MGEWKELTLGDVSVDGGHYGIAASAVPFETSLPTYLRITDICDDGTINKSGLTSVDDSNSSEYILSPNDLVIARTGASTGRNYFYDGRDGELVYAGFLIKFSIDPNKIYPQYVKYWFLSPFYKAWLNSHTDGSTRANINAVTLADCPIRFPADLPTQRRIAAVLGALDDKIEVNRKICENLEAQAQALFKAWFVDFEPFGGKRPEGWKMGELGSLIEVCYGKDHKKRPDGNIPVYGSGGYMRSVDIPLYDKESVLIPRKGSLNNILYVNEAFWTVDTMFYSKMRVPCVAKYVHQFLKTKDMEEMNVGSAVPSMTTDILNHMQVLIPDALSLSKFDAITDALYSSIKHANRESRALAAMRDALLPKLMSGELAVEKVEVGDACASHAGQGKGEG